MNNNKPDLQNKPRKKSSNTQFDKSHRSDNLVKNDSQINFKAERKIIFVPKADTESIVKKGLFSDKILKTHKNVIDHVNDEDSYYGGTANSSRTLTHDIILVFFNSIIVYDDEFNSVNYTGKYKETYDALLSLVNSCAYLTQKDKKNFSEKAYKWFIKLNKIANINNHDIVDIKAFNFQSYVVMPYNVLVKTLDKMLRCNSDLFSTLRFHGDAKSGIYSKNKPARDYEVRTNPEAENPDLTVYFDFEDIHSEETSNKVFGILYTKKNFITLKYKLGYSVINANTIKNVSLNIDSIYNNDTKKQLPFEKEKNDLVNNIICVRFDDSQITSNQYYVKINVCYDDLKCNQRKIFREILVDFNVGKKN